MNTSSNEIANSTPSSSNEKDGKAVTKGYIYKLTETNKKENEKGSGSTLLNTNEKDAIAVNNEHMSNLTEKIKKETGKGIENPPSGSTQEDTETFNRKSDDDENLSDSLKELSLTPSSLDILLEEFSEDSHSSRSETKLNLSKKEKATKGKIEDNKKSIISTEYSERELPCKPLSCSCEFPDPLELTEQVCCFGMCKKRRDLSRISEFWLISVPKTDTAWADLNKQTEKENLSQNYKFHIPTFKVGTLDVLVSLIEQLSSLDAYVEDVTIKLCEYMKCELSDEPDIYEENLKVNDLYPVTFLTRFVWNKPKYPTWHPIPLIADLIFAHVENIDKSFKTKIKIIDNLISSLGNYERRQTDSLQFRYLGDIVKKEHFVMDSKYLTTLLVVVPNRKINQWLKSYEKLSEMVVPESSTKIYDDGKQSLFNVTLCKNNIEQFIVNARRKMFIVRDFKYSEESFMTERIHYDRLSRIKRRQAAAIFRWAKIHFGECFEAWVHVKALRVFVESVLRFSLPINYESILVLPLKSKHKLKVLINKLFSDVDSVLSSGPIEDIPGGLEIYGVEEYYPYVYFVLNMDYIVLKKDMYAGEKK